MNLISPGQVMNTSFNRLKLVNTYGAFGTRGTRAVRDHLRRHAAVRRRSPRVWREYEFPGQARRSAPAAGDRRAVSAAARLADLVRGDGHAARVPVDGALCLEAPAQRSRHAEPAGEQSVSRRAAALRARGACIATASRDRRKATVRGGSASVWTVAAAALRGECRGAEISRIARVDQRRGKVGSGRWSVRSECVVRPNTDH